MLIYIAAISAILSAIGATLTLPGIVLTMDMSVDSNVKIFERTTEKLRAEKLLQLQSDRDFLKPFVTLLIPTSPL
jgi:preprotein translocase subunit SecD